MTKVKLGVNIDHVATIQRLRDTPYPNLIKAAQECIAGGADQITVHLREDRRHIRDEDVIRLKNEISVPLNLEMAATREMLEFALKLKPHSICIVPEKREERTTEGGLDLLNLARNEMINEIAIKAKEAHILTSFFIEPTPQDVMRSKELGAEAVELHTGTMCIAWQAKDMDKYQLEFEKVRFSVSAALKQGLIPHAGHGIDYETIHELQKIDGIVEYNIGHSIVSEAVFCGIKEATQKMKKALEK